MAIRRSGVWQKEVPVILKARTFLTAFVVAFVAMPVAMAQEFVPPATTSMTTTIDGLLVIGGAVALALAVYGLFRRGTRKV